MGCNISPLSIVKFHLSRWLSNLQNHSDIHSISIGNEYTISIVDIELIDDENLYNDGIPSFENDDQDLSKADQHIVEGTSDATPQIWQRK
jgi:hypothetical protein